jgi:hypothetical protein
MFPTPRRGTRSQTPAFRRIARATCLLALTAWWGVAAGESADAAVREAQSTPAPVSGSVTVSGSGSATVSGQGVVAIVRGRDGTTQVSEYEPAPGVSDAELYRRLLALGVPGLQAPGVGQGAGTFSSTTCSLGSATTLECPQVHWARNGFAHPQVYFVDHTSSAWPVSTVVPVWNQAHGVDSWYRWQTCPYIAGTHCVGVYNNDYGATGWVGWTNYAFDANRNLVDSRVTVYLNDHYPITAARHRKSACHELGHVLGLGHNSSSGSCMISGAYETPTPSAQDFSLVANIYSSF